MAKPKEVAIVFVQQQRRQRYLIFVFIGVVLLSLIVLWRGFLAKPSLQSRELEVKPEVIRKIEIDFAIFEHPFFTQVQGFPRISSFEATGEVQLGRPNPFAPVEELPLSAVEEEEEE